MHIGNGNTTGLATEQDSGYQRSPKQATLRNRLTAQAARLAEQLADVKAAIEALDKNPNFEEVLNVIGKVNC